MRRYIAVLLIGVVLIFSSAWQGLYSVQAQPSRHPHAESTLPLTGQIAFTSNRTGNYQIYIMNADGTNLVRVTQDPDTDNFGPYLSPDGSKILFSSGDLASGDYGFKVIDANGLHPAVISKPNEVAAAHPQWSPDSSRIIYGVLKNSSVDFYLVNADGTNRISLNYPRPTGVPQVKWVSSSQIILTTIQGVMLANPDATGLKLLAPYIVGSFALNTQLALESGYIITLDGPMTTVDVADASGADAKRQFAIPAHSILYYLDWSPNGRAIGVNVRNPSQDQLNGYYVYTADGILFHATFDVWSVWSPDSNYLSYTGADKNGSSQVFVVGAYPGATPQQITFGDYSNAQPSWSVGSVSEAVF